MFSINSKETPLPAPQVIMECVRNFNNTGLPPEVAAIAITKELTMPNIDTTQIGNTVFVGHRGPKKDNKDKLIGRAFNIDTASNFVNNAMEYIKYLQQKGYTRYVTQYDGDVYDAVFKALQRREDSLGVLIRTAKTKGKTIVGMKLDVAPEAKED